MYVIQVGIGNEWEATYAIPKSSEQEAVQVAVNAASNQFSCSFPPTIEKIEQSDNCWLNILSDNAELMI